MVTCGTYLKRHHFESSKRLRLLCDTLQRLAAKYNWNLQAWAVFSNHYHWVGLSPDPATLRTFVSELHTETSTKLNGADGTPGRQVWFQYWETRLTYQRSYLARLSYVHRNAVHHRLVCKPSLYPWCSAGWLEQRANASFYKSIMRLRIERVNVPDEFQVVWLPEGG
jgi:putative transposase